MPIGQLAIEHFPPLEDSSSSRPSLTWSGPMVCRAAKRRTPNHPCPVCGKQYVNEGSLRKHMATHPEAAGLTAPLRMWPCSVCQAVFTHESGEPTGVSVEGGATTVEEGVICRVGIVRHKPVA